MTDKSENNRNDLENRGEGGLRERLLQNDDQFIPKNKMNDDSASIQESDTHIEPLRPQEKKFVIISGGQGGFDLDEIFQFGQDQSQQQKQNQKRYTITKRVTRIFGDKSVDIEETASFKYDEVPKYFAFYMLIQSAFIGGCQPGWIQSIVYDKILRQAWRFFFCAVMLVPFIMYEYRTGTEKVRQAYALKYVFQHAHIRKLFISALNTAITMTISLVCQQYSYVIHATLLVQMSNFWLSIGRRWNQEKLHFVEEIGQGAAILGMIVITYDVWSIDADTLPITVHTEYTNDRVFLTVPWQRAVIGHGFPIFCSYVMTKLSRLTSDIKNIYPPFLSMFILSVFCWIQLSLTSYFTDATSFSWEKRWGWFGVIQDGQFIHFMYLSIVINFGMLSSQIFISKLFEPIIPAMTQLSEPVIAQLGLHIAGVQHQPGATSFIGYMMILPGQLLILLGQYIMSKEKEYKEKFNAVNISHSPPPAVEHRSVAIRSSIKNESSSTIRPSIKKINRVSFLDDKNK